MGGIKTGICLICPPSPFLLDERVFMSLGILRVAAVLEQAGYPIEMLDLSGIENYEHAVSIHAISSKANTWGITATSPQMPAAVKIAKTIRARQPHSKIILGGPHATLINAARKRNAKRAGSAFEELVKIFDVLVAGDGEFAIFKAIEPDAPKLIDADDPKSEMFLTNQAFDELPFPARHLIDVDSYKYQIEGHRALSLIGQLGCPYECTFCGGRNSPMLRKIRNRTVSNIVAEIKNLYETYGVTGFMMYDDEVNVSRSMIDLMDELEDLQERLNVDFRLRGFVKSNLFTDEQAAAMYRAGFRWILVGFESGSPRILENIRKKATREQNTKCLNIARSQGLKVKALMSLGHAGESEDTIQETKDWLLKTKPDDFDATVITTYPGTPYWDEAVETTPGIWTYTARNGDRLHGYDVDFNKTAEYYKGVPGEYQSFVFTDYLSSDDLVRLRDDLENEVREKLGVPFNPGAPGVRFEASMGQLPGNILRTSQ